MIDQTFSLTAMSMQRFPNALLGATAFSITTYQRVMYPRVGIIGMTVDRFVSNERNFNTQQRCDVPAGGSSPEYVEIRTFV